MQSCRECLEISPRLSKHCLRLHNQPRETPALRLHFSPNLVHRTGSGISSQEDSLPFARSHGSGSIHFLDHQENPRRKIRMRFEIPVAPKTVSEGKPSEQYHVCCGSCQTAVQASLA